MKKPAGEAKLLIIMAAIVLLGGGFLVFGPKGDGASPLTPPKPTPTPRVLSRSEFDEVLKGARHIKGDKNATITIVEFADFECPACRKAYNRLLHKVGTEIPVRFAFRNRPQPMHETARPAAIAAEAAGRQGKFWEMYAALFKEEETDLSPSYIRAQAKAVGLDTAQFEKDYADPAIAKMIDEDLAAAEKFSLQVTPTFLIHDQKKNTIVTAVGIKALLTELQGLPGVPPVAEVSAQP